MPNKLTPARVRRGFKNLRMKCPLPARAPKPTKPGPGRPPGAKNRRRATIEDVGLVLKTDEAYARPSHHKMGTLRHILRPVVAVDCGAGGCGGDRVPLSMARCGLIGGPGARSAGPRRRGGRPVRGPPGHRRQPGRDGRRPLPETHRARCGPRRPAVRAVPRRIPHAPCKPCWDRPLSSPRVTRPLPQPGRQTHLKRSALTKREGTPCSPNSGQRWRRSLSPGRCWRP